jgi:hypothetical protein
MRTCHIPGSYADYGEFENVMVEGSEAECNVIAVTLEDAEDGDRK